MASVSALHPWPVAKDQGSGPVSLCASIPELIAESALERAELSLFRRSLAPATADAFGGLGLGNFRDVLLQGAGPDIVQHLIARIDAQQWPRLAVEQLLRDVRLVIDQSAHWSPLYTLRLEHVRDDACRKFHKDRTDLRLITTYVGRGTQWIDGPPWSSDSVVQEMETFDVGIFLGLRDSDRRRMLHRSPPLEPADRSRLVLVMDIERPDWGKAG